MKLSPLLIAFFLLLPLASADIDRFFSVKEGPGEVDAVPGEVIVVPFTLANRELVHPDNVTAYIDPCPVGWDCGRRVFSFADSGVHAANLTISVPETALPKRYTMYILLESDEDTRRGDDKILVTLVSEDMASVKSYDEYVAERAAAESMPAPVREPLPDGQEVLEDAGQEPGDDGGAVADDAPVEEGVPETPDDFSSAGEGGQGERVDALIEDVERLESNRQFVEYASAVLLALLVFVAVGAFVSYKKKE